ncbi:MAG: DUF3108 domain-containing protein [Proteobacteria bacterium]|nr:DUF3108 domain-containing protein [Pseudomonadota bacterium]
MWRAPVVVSVVLFGMMIAGCAGAEAMTQPVAAVAAPTAAAQELGVAPGETLAFEIRIGGILAGEAQLAVGEIGVVDGRRRIRIHSRAATAGAVGLIKHVVDEATTELDVETGKPINFDTLVENGDKRVTSTGAFVGQRARVTYVRSEDNNVPRTSIINFANADVHDAHSAMAAIRGWHPALGAGAAATRTVFVLGGKRLWRVDVTYAGTETIGTELGNRAVVKLTGKAYRARGNLSIETTTPSRTFTVYLSDDADRVPLRVIGQTELGDVAMTLTDYARP